MPKTSIVFAAALAVFMSGPLNFIAAYAQQGTKVLSKHKDWALYSHTGEPATICFISAKPREKEPKDFDKDPSYFYISAWPDDGVKAEVSVKIGTQLQDGSDVDIQIGSSRYKLFIKEDKAFVNDATQELKLIESMKRGSFMKVSSTVSDGTRLEETYSLLGVTAAVNALRRGCS